MKKYSDGGPTIGDEHPYLSKLRDMLKAKASPITSTDSALDEIDKLEKGPQASTDTPKGYDNGGPVMSEPGLEDASVNDFLAPALMGGLAGKAAPMLKGLGEAGEVTLGRMAPKMEEAGEDAVTAFVKGIQKNPNGADIKIYGVKGPAEKLKAMFGDTEPGSVPEHILRQKGILPEVKTINKNAPNSYADGGVVDNNDSDYSDKLQAVLQAMGMGAKAAIAPLMPPSTAPTTPIPAAVNPTGSIQAPIVPATPPPAPVSMDNVPPPAQDMKMPPPQAAPAQQTPSHPANDILQKLTNGDGDKMQALLANLKDEDKRYKFAQALGIIGDTLGNVGMAKAGKAPEGFQLTDQLSKMHKESKESQVSALTAQLASDPNSQTSHMAQQMLMQAMGIKPGDPREASIRRLPAQAITGMMPQMNEAVKANLEREKTLMEAKKADVGNTTRNREIDVSERNADKALQGVQNTAALGVLKDTSSLRDLVPGEGVRDIARATLERGMGTKPVPPITATNSMGHKIRSTDGGHTWMPM